MNKNLRVLSLSKEKHVMEAEKATRTDDGETEMVVGGEAPVTKDDDGFGGGNGGVPSATTKTNGKVEEKKNSIHQIAPEEAPFAGGGGPQDRSGLLGTEGICETSMGTNERIRGNNALRSETCGASECVCRGVDWGR